MSDFPAISQQNNLSDMPSISYMTDEAIREILTEVHSIIQKSHDEQLKQITESLYCFYKTSLEKQAKQALEIIDLVCQLSYLEYREFVVILRLLRIQCKNVTHLSHYLHTYQKKSRSPKLCTIWTFVAKMMLCKSVPSFIF